MPIYEYECGRCRKRFEKIQKVDAPPCRQCPSCGGSLKKLVTAPAIQFKGTGFYINDYAKKNGPAPDVKGKAKDETKADKPDKAAAPVTDAKPSSD